MLRNRGGACAGTSARRTTRGQGGETYVRMKGKWMYLYRAMDSCDATIDFLLSAKRDLATAQRFLTKTVGSYAFRKVSRSALMVSASVVGMPCGKPL
jgi:transposase-like protein